MKPLYELYSEQVALIRADQMDEAAAMMKPIQKEYKKTEKYIRKWL